MGNHSKLPPLGAAMLAAAVLAAGPAFAAKVAVDGYNFNLPAGSEKNLDAVRVLVKVSDAIGFTRIDADRSMSCLGCVTPAMRYKGTGMWMGTDKAEVTIDFDYRFPGVRYSTVVGGKDSGTVAVKDLAWDEAKPGVFAKTSTEKALERMIPIYLLPNSVVYVGQEVADKIKLATVGQTRTLTIPMPMYGTDMKATLDFEGHPVKTEMTINGKVYSGEFTDFTNDRMDMHVYGPQRIIMKVDGKVVSDIAVEYHWSNTYIVFPTPKEVASK